MTYIMTSRQLNVLVRALQELTDNNGKLSYGFLYGTFLACQRATDGPGREVVNVREREIKFSENCKNYLTSERCYGNITLSIRGNYSSIVRRIYYESV